MIASNTPLPPSYAAMTERDCGYEEKPFPIAEIEPEVLRQIEWTGMVGLECRVLEA